MLEEIAEKGLSVPFCAVAGNHDVLEKTDMPHLLYERAFGPRRYWFACGNALFVAFDTSMEVCTPEDLTWLDTTLGRLRPQYDLCFVWTHVPPRDPRGGRPHALPAASGEALMAVLTKHKVTALFASHIHSWLQDEWHGVPVYISGGAGAERDTPILPHHYCLCTVHADGSWQLERRDVSGPFISEYLEYAFKAEFPLAAVLFAAGLMVLAGIFLALPGAGKSV